MPLLSLAVLLSSMFRINLPKVYYSCVSFVEHYEMICDTVFDRETFIGYEVNLLEWW
jgi:hypothetical protein